VAVFNQEHVPLFSLDYLRVINNYTIHQNPVHSLDEGMLSVKNGQNRALIVIGENFTESIRRIGYNSYYDYYPEDHDMNMSKVNLYLDMTSKSLNMK